MPIIVAFILIAAVIAGFALYYTIATKHVDKLIGKVEIIESDGYYRVLQFGRLELNLFDQFYGGEPTEYKWRYVNLDGELTGSTCRATYTSLETAQKIAALAERHFNEFTEWKAKHPNRINDKWKKVG